MAQIISWRFDRSDRRFILKFSDKRRVRVKTIDAILRMDEALQRDILALGVPIANQCERTETVIRRLKRRFQADDDDDVFELPTCWSLNEQLRMVRVTYSNRDEDSLIKDKVLNTKNVSLLRQLLTLTPSPIITTRIVIMFKSRMSFGLYQLMVLNTNVVDDDESQESYEQSNGYISNVIPSNEKY